MLGFAQEAVAVPRLALSSVRGFPGTAVEVSLTLRYGSNDLQNVVALQADLVIDSGNAVSQAPLSGTALKDHTLASSEPASRTRRVLVYSLSNATLTNGAVATIPFSVPQGSFQNVRLTLANVILSTAEALSVPVTTAGGGVAINPVFVRPSGDVDGFLTVSTNAGPEQCFVIQATSDFSIWVNVFTNTAAGDLLQFCDLTAQPFPHRFYRALLCQAADGARIATLIATINRLDDGRIRFEFSGANNRRYIIQGSTNLRRWDDLETVSGAGAPVRYIDPASTNVAHRFYRVRLE